MVIEPGKIFLPNYIIQYFFRIQNLEGGADRVDKKEGPGLSGPGVHGTPKFWQISQPYTQPKGANYAPIFPGPPPQIFKPSEIPGVDDVV